MEDGFLIQGRKGLETGSCSGTFAAMPTDGLPEGGSPAIVEPTDLVADAHEWGRPDL